jgi:hypothetical protein
MVETLFSSVKKINLPESDYFPRSVDREHFIRQPEPAATDEEYRHAYTIAMVEVMSQLTREVTRNPDSQVLPPVLEIPNGGTLPSLLVRQELATTDRYIVPKSILKEARKNFFAIRPVIEQLYHQRTPLTEHYVIPEDTIESGRTLLLVMMALTLYCKKYANLTPRFSILVPTTDTRHLEVDTSQIRQWSERQQVPVEIIFAYEEEYSDTRKPPEHGDAHALISQLLTSH